MAGAGAARGEALVHGGRDALRELGEALVGLGLVEAAGGLSVLGSPGAKSYRVGWDEVRAADPEIVVCAPCGFGLEQSVSLARELVAAEVLPTHAAVWAVDANASFARPGPRLVDGVEALAGILHPEVADPSGIAQVIRVAR